jgi:hypothetical protein
LTQNPPTTAAPAPQKCISKKIRTAIDAMVAGDAKTITDPASAAGLSREHLSRELSEPHLTEHLRQKVVRRLPLHPPAPATQRSTCWTAKRNGP